MLLRRGALALGTLLGVTRSTVPGAGWALAVVLPAVPDPDLPAVPSPGCAPLWGPSGAPGGADCADLADLWVPR